MGQPPNHLPEDVAAAWKEIETCALPGVLICSDRFVMEIAASLLAEFRANRADFKAAKYSHLIGCLARLGLTPADRQTLGTYCRAPWWRMGGSLELVSPIRRLTS
ncbi:hypothetical protein [Xanthomonas bromi]|uniref:hypothetical protein n=1 Tax=Xanthomonas bromi TaxID=56449 RepID=UPI0011AFD907|nr:hypothetical protein [Xanthomonas bromi]